MYANEYNILQLEIYLIIIDEEMKEETAVLGRFKEALRLVLQQRPSLKQLIITTDDYVYTPDFFGWASFIVWSVMKQ